MVTGGSQFPKAGRPADGSLAQLFNIISQCTIDRNHPFTMLRSVLLLKTGMVSAGATAVPDLRLQLTLSEALRIALSDRTIIREARARLEQSLRSCCYQARPLRSRICPSFTRSSRISIRCGTR